MNPTKESKGLSATNSPLFMELIKVLLEKQNGKEWHLKIVNLIQQIFNAESVVIYNKSKHLFTFSQNKINESAYQANYHSNESTGERVLKEVSSNIYLLVDFKSTPTKENLLDLGEAASLIEQSIKLKKTGQSSPLEKAIASAKEKTKTIINSNVSAKDKLSKLSSLIKETLNTSRALIKVFSSCNSSVYDTYLCAESSSKDLIDSISVIPSHEQRFISKIKANPSTNYYSTNTSEEINNEIEKLLSIKTILLQPIISAEKAIGLISLHQCDHHRTWTEGEEEFISYIATILGLLLSNEQASNQENQRNNILSTEEFLREVGNLPIEHHETGSAFSLILIDIEGLNKINSAKGFIAGNLVLSQTSRILTRLYENKHLVARYNNDEFAIILKSTNELNALDEAEKLRDSLKNRSVLGVGVVEYNFAYATYPTHANSASELLGVLEQSMQASKKRGKARVCGAGELKLFEEKMPSIISERSNIKTGPDIASDLNKQLEEENLSKEYNADILDSVQSLAVALDAKDSYTEGHSQRVSEYAFLLAKHIGLDQKEQEWVRLAAFMHDIGKIGIPESILCKNGKLTKEEYEVMKEHPVIGARILSPIKPLKEVAELVLYHHEYWDGSGYPQGYSKEKIPVGSRIVSICDAYQAMTSDRPYRAGLPKEEAFKRLRHGKNKQWDPELIDKFIDLIEATN